MGGSTPRDRLRVFVDLGVAIVGFGALILLLAAVVAVVYVVGEELSWYLPNELVAVLAGLLGFYLLVANKKIRKALGEWLRE